MEQLTIPSPWECECEVLVEDVQTGGVFASRRMYPTAGFLIIPIPDEWPDCVRIRIRSKYGEVFGVRTVRGAEVSSPVSEQEFDVIVDANTVYRVLPNPEQVVTRVRLGRLPVGRSSHLFALVSAASPRRVQECWLIGFDAPNSVFKFACR